RAWIPRKPRNREDNKMSHTITCKLNKSARQHQNASGMTFFVDLGEKNYNFKTKDNEWTNYSAALFAKDGQIQFYADALVEDAIIEVSGTGIIIEMPDDPQYKPRLQIQDAKLGYVNAPERSVMAAPQQSYQQQAPMQQQPQATLPPSQAQQYGHGVNNPNDPPF
ncbi:MAG: hypothetical protein V3S69_04160, partial [Dehalococcoidales bacterium]